MEQVFNVRGLLFAWKVVWLKLANRTHGYGLHYSQVTYMQDIHVLQYSFPWSHVHMYVLLAIFPQGVCCLCAVNLVFVYMCVCTCMYIGLKNRASTCCLRCERLRSSGQFTCGRCGHMYWTKPVVDIIEDDGEGEIMQTTGQSKKRKQIAECIWNFPEEPGMCM